jgi:hypothetical protein
VLVPAVAAADWEQSTLRSNSDTAENAATPQTENLKLETRKLKLRE